MQISAGAPVGLALSRTGTVLFRPFRFRKWLVLGIGAALSLAGEGGLNFNGSSNSSSGGGGGGGGGPTWDDATAWMRGHAALLVTGGVILFLIVAGLYLLGRWLNSRGQFIFFDTVVNNEARVKAPWAEYRAQGNSLFVLRVLWDLILGAIYLGIFAISLAIAWRDISHAMSTGNYEFTASTGFGIAFLVLSTLAMVVPFWVASATLFHLAMPVMYVRRMKAWPAMMVAWREMFLPNKGACLLYFLMMVVVAVVQMIWSMFGLLMFVLLTCCTGLLVLIIPIVGNYPIAVLSLPVLTFRRAYQLHFIEQFGPEYHVPWREPLESGFPVVMAPPVSQEGV